MASPCCEQGYYSSFGALYASPRVLLLEPVLRGKALWCSGGRPSVPGRARRPGVGSRTPPRHSSVSPDGVQLDAYVKGRPVGRPFSYPSGSSLSVGWLRE